MSRIAYVDGQYVPHALAAVHIEDRGYQFADGVYEVCGVEEGKLVDLEPHLDRLERSLGEIGIPSPMSRPALSLVLAELVRRNRVRFGIVYLQITRGVAPRSHIIPEGITPTLVATARSVSEARIEGLIREGGAVVTTPDIRWQRCDIKSVGLLANVLAKSAAREAGADEAWMVDAEGYVTEGASTNAWIIDGVGRIITRPADSRILSGVTRRGIIAAARGAHLEVEERPFTVAEAKAAREAFYTSSSVHIVPVVRIDGKVVGNGAPGLETLKLRALYREYLRGRA